MGVRQFLSSSFEMVVKTDLCNYSGFRIYPGHGKKYVRVDHKMFTFVNAKSERCFMMKRRNLPTKWTVQYRRINKKGTIEQDAKKRRAKKAVVKTREITGISAEMLEKALCPPSRQGLQGHRRRSQGAEEPQGCQEGWQEVDFANKKTFAENQTQGYVFSYKCVAE